MGYFDEIKDSLGKKDKSDSPTLTSKPTKHLIKVLIVEDEPTLSEMYSDKFIHEGFVVITATNGEEGLAKALSEKPNIILLDLMMPVMDGKIMLKKLREIPEFSKLPVIIVTNVGDVESITETQRYADANEFLIKSNVSVDEVVKKVKEWTNLV